MIHHAVQSVKSLGVHFLHNFGIHCATHQIRVILISCVVITSLLYPALAIYSSSQPQLLRDFSSRILDPILEHDAIQWYNYKNDLRNVWHGYDALHVRDDSISRVRCANEHTVRAERLFVRGFAPTGSGALTRETLLDTLRLERVLTRALKDERIPCVRKPGDTQCFVASPLSFWGHDEATLLADPDVLRTLNEEANATASRTSLTLEMLLAGRETTENSGMRTKLHFSLFLAVTFFFRDNNCLGQTGHKNFLKLLRKVVPPSAHPLRQDLKPSLTSLEYMTEASASDTAAPLSIINALLYFSYMAFIVMFWTSMKRMSSVHSRIGLAFTGVVEVLVSTVTSISVCAIFGFKVTMVPWAIFPVVILFIGAENMFRLVDAVVKTPISLPVKERIAQGLSVAGMSNTLRVVSYNSILGVISVFAVGAIRQFCVFAIVVLVAHWFLIHTFFIAVLSIDLQRLELDELLRLGSSASPVPPESPTRMSSRHSGQPLKHAILSLRNILGSRAAKNVSLVLLLAITGTLYYATYPSTMRSHDESRIAQTKSASVHTDITTGGAALQLWRTLNPDEDVLLHMRVESPTYITFQPTIADDHSQESSRSSGSHKRRLLSMRTLWWVGKILVLPIALTTTTLYGLLLYLLKDTDRLELEREKQDHNQTNRDSSPVDASITFSVLPRVCETDVERLAVSRDGNVVAAVSSLSEVLVWKKDRYIRLDLGDVVLDAGTATSSSFSNVVTALALDGVGALCAIGTSSGVVSVWALDCCVPHPAPIYTFDGSSRAVVDLLFCDSGWSSKASSPSSSQLPQFLLAIYDMGTVAKWRLAPDQSQSYVPPSSSHRSSLVKSMIVKVAEDQVVVTHCFDDGMVELRDVDKERGVILTPCTLQAGNPNDLVCMVNACFLKLDGTRRLIVGAVTDNGVVSLWDASTRECIHILDDTYRGITQLHLIPIPTTVCPQCGEHPPDSLSLTFSHAYTLYVWRIYLISQQGKCACPVNQPPTTLAGPSALDGTTIGGRRARSGSGVNGLSPRSRNPSFSSLSSVAATGDAMGTASFPISAHGFHSRRGSEKDSAYSSGRRLSDHFLSAPVDEDPPDGEPVGPLDPKMATEPIWRNVLVVRVIDILFERGRWGLLSNGTLVGLRKRRRPDSLLGGTQGGRDTVNTEVPNGKRWESTKRNGGLSRAVKERWEVWTLDLTTQNPRVPASSLASLRPKTATPLKTKSIPPTTLTGEFASLPFTRVGPLIIERGACLVGFGNTIGYVDCTDLVGHAPPLSLRRGPPPNGHTISAAALQKKTL